MSDQTCILLDRDIKVWAKDHLHCSISQFVRDCLQHYRELQDGCRGPRLAALKVAEQYHTEQIDAHQSMRQKARDEIDRLERGTTHAETEVRISRLEAEVIALKLMYLDREIELAARPGANREHQQKSWLEARAKKLGLSVVELEHLIENVKIAGGEVRK
ncbi:MAG: hypothetical protein PHZ19_09915 [Candidatus Thermoplasmatota archaeon]|nr:hypothetical protein [Candidatus Thermoplasmatota archaeon]